VRVLLTRASCAALALAACAWFALGIRQSSDLNHATAIVSGLTGQIKLSPAQARSANSLLSSAGVLNPDLQVDVLRARVALLTDDRASAKRILLSVVRREPMNLDAWYGLATSATDGATVSRALARLAQLEPKVRPAP
jgi:predicted Zn-dependent protease